MIFYPSTSQHKEYTTVRKYVLTQLIGQWKKSLDENFVAGTVLTDLSKGFDCIPHDFLIAKLHAHGFSEKTMTFIYSYLKRQKKR